jgi:hypothetical protein
LQSGALSPSSQGRKASRTRRRSSSLAPIFAILGDRPAEVERFA